MSILPRSFAMAFKDILVVFFLKKSPNQHVFAD